MKILNVMVCIFQREKDDKSKEWGILINKGQLLIDHDGLIVNTPFYKCSDRPEEGVLNLKFEGLIDKIKQMNEKD